MAGPERPHPPARIRNRPALSAVGYRVGTYASVRRSMLEAIARHSRAAAAVPGDEPAAATMQRPLAPWTSRSPDDYGIAFVEMWAYLADVLTFYQERIANEAFLRTATQAESVTSLVSLIGYRPAPGRAAAAHVAFAVEEGADVRLDPGLLVQSVPGQDETPQKFETVDELVAHASLNVLRPRSRGPQTLPRGARRAVLDGVGHGVGPGDWVAVVGDERREDPESERWDLRLIVTADEDAGSDTTTISWEGGLGWGPRWGREVIEPAVDPEVWVFRGQASPFGHNAPDWRLLAASPAFAELVRENDAFGDWNDKHLPEDPDHAHYLFLDAVYPNIVPGQWVALVAAEVAARQRYERYVELYPVRGVADTTRLNYTLSAKVTRLTVDLDSTGQPENIDHFGMRTTVVLVQSEQLPLADVPLGHSPVSDARSEARPVAGDAIELDGHHPALHRGRTLLVTGSLVDGAGESAEPVEVVGVHHEDGARTTITLAAPLARAYERGSVRIYGNVATATHGETVAGEVLGDGDASRRFQTFDLRKRPVTFVSQPGAPGGVASTVEVRVDGVRWDEVPELHDRGPDERVYVARREPDDTLHLRFGDGVTGARLVSGRGNVEATYRVGLGPDGNVRAGTLETLLTKPLGLKAATNPAPAGGGAAAEDPASVKETAPGTVRTFGRVVSLHDFEDAAREYVGVAKASARWRWDGERRVVDLVVAGDDGASVEPIASDLRADLDARRDPHQPLRLRDFRRMPVSVALTVTVDRAHVPETVEDAAGAALRSTFAFDRLRLGQSVHLSDVYRAVQQVAGVVAVRVEEFRFRHPADRGDRGGDAPVQPRLLVAPDELAWVEDPDDLRVTARQERGEAS